MAVIHIPRRRFPATAPAAAHEGWACAFEMRTGHDLTGNMPRLGGNVPVGVGRGGVGLHVNARQRVTTGAVVPGITDAITFVFIAEKIADISGASDFLLGEHRTSVGAYNYGFYESVASKQLAFFIHNGSTVVSINAPSSDWVPNSGPQVFVGTFGGGDVNARLYCNGESRGFGFLGGSIRRDSLAHLRCAYWQDATVPSFVLYAAAIAPMRLSPDEVRQRFSTVSTAYDAIFRAEPRRIYSFPTGPILIPTLSTPSFAGRVPSVSLTY